MVTLFSIDHYMMQVNWEHLAARDRGIGQTSLLVILGNIRQVCLTPFVLSRHPVTLVFFCFSSHWGTRLKTPAIRGSIYFA